MKKQGNMWFFESHEEIRNYLAQGLTAMCHFVYLTTRQRAWISEYGKVVADCDEQGEPYVLTDEDKNEEYHTPERVVSRLHSIRAGIGDIEDYPAGDYAVKKPWQVVELEAPTVVEGFYKAGEHLAERVHTVGQKQTRFTTKELTAVKNAVELENDRDDVEYLYRITTQTGKYQCHQDSLWWMMLQMELAEGVGPAKRHVFTIKEKDAGDKDVILRLSFTIDKEVSRIKQCLANDELRPSLNHPAIETATGVIVGTSGHILTAHKLKGYEQDPHGALPAWAKGMLSVPKEMCQMKGTVTIDVVEGKWEESYRKSDGSTELHDVSGIIVTATDQSGRQAVLKVSTYFVFPNWRSVIPQKLGPAIHIDTKALADGVKRIMPHVNCASEMITVTASAGDKVLELSGQDYDFSKGGSVKVDVCSKIPCGVRVGMKASMVITAMGFDVRTMHYKAADEAVMFIGDKTITLQMPMLVDESDKGPKPTDKQLKRFDVGKWASAHNAASEKGKVKSEKFLTPKGMSVARNAAASKNRTKPAASNEMTVASNEMTVASNEVTEPSIEDRLRAALRRQLAMAA